MPTLRGELENYMGVIPKDASLVQVKETERAFMAGALAYRNVSIDAAANHSLEIAETKLKMAEKELQDYLNEMMEEARL